MKHWFKLAVVGAGMALGTAAQASTIEVWNDTQYDVPANTVANRGSVTCTSCEVLTYNPSSFTFSSTTGELFDGPTNSGDATEAAWVNTVLGTSFTTADVTAGKVSTGIFDSYSYTTSAQYVILKIGKNPDYTVLMNTSGGAMTWSWNNYKADGGGLSHYITLGDPAPVPLPAAGLLLLGALGGLAAVRRRKA